MSVNKISPAMAQMHSKMIKINDLIQGGDTIVSAGEKYLPKGLMETDKAYKQRLQHTRYVDMFNPTINSITGLIFNDNVKYIDLDAKLEPFKENADSVGTHFDLVLHSMFKQALSYGVSFALVDMPRVERNSLADEVGIEPYITLVSPLNVISYKTEVINGKTVLSQIVIRELIEEDIDEFETEVVEQFRVLNRGYYRIFRGTEKTSYQVVEDGETGLDYIPLFDLTLGSNNFTESEPPLYELANLCIYHYQELSEIAYALWTSITPIRTAIGVSQEELKGLSISNSTVVRTDNENSKFGFWEYSPTTLQFASERVEKLTEAIAKEGLNSIGKTQVTATAEIIDNIKTESKINAMARKLRDTGELILQCVADFKGLKTDKTGTIDINVKLDKGVDAQFITAVSSMYAKSAISLDTMFTMIQTGKMPDNFDIEDEKTKIAVGVLE